MDNRTNREVIVLSLKVAAVVIVLVLLAALWLDWDGEAVRRITQ